MNWFKQHADTIAVLSALISCFFWMHGRFATLEKEMASLDKNIAIIKTVLIMKEIMPREIATNNERFVE